MANDNEKAEQPAARVSEEDIVSVNGTPDDPAWQDENFRKGVEQAEGEAAAVKAREAQEAAEEAAHQAEFEKAEEARIAEEQKIAEDAAKAEAELKSQQIERQVAAAAEQKAKEAKELAEASE